MKKKSLNNFQLSDKDFLIESAIVDGMSYLKEVTFTHNGMVYCAYKRNKKVYIKPIRVYLQSGDTKQLGYVRGQSIHFWSYGVLDSLVDRIYYVHDD